MTIHSLFKFLLRRSSVCCHEQIPRRRPTHITQDRGLALFHGAVWKIGRLGWRKRLEDFWKGSSGPIALWKQKMCSPEVKDVYFRLSEGQKTQSAQGAR